ncbi:MAG: M15 family metallopeptidase, partial [Myxococcota bacterium]
AFRRDSLVIDTHIDVPYRIAKHGTELSVRQPVEEAPKFEGTHGPLPQEVVKRVTNSSWRDDCPLPLDRLTYMKVKHWGYDHSVHDGELIVDKEVAAELLEIFNELFDAEFPIEKMRLVDDYGASDVESMSDNNTSAFNCRWIHGKKNVFSMHSYGRAIDINPRTNPYVSKHEVVPASGARFVERTNSVTGIIVANDACHQAFTERGWDWGGSWKSIKDYQHFEKRKKKPKKSK